MQHLIKSKIWLKFSLFLFLFSFNSYTTKLDENINEVEGIVQQVEKTNFTKLVLKSEEKLLVHYYDEIDIKIGDRVRLLGSLEKPSQNRVFNLFNYQNYLKSKKIFWILKADKIEIIDNNNFFYKLKQNFESRINEKDSKDYIANFILGTNNLDDKVIESYKTNGTLHLLAISGAHIAILILIMKKTIKNEFIIILILLFYLFLTGFKTSITRAILFYIMLFLNKKLNIKKTPTQILLFLAILLLINSPYLIYDIGFQFSFIISFFLIQTKYIINKKNNFFYKLLVTSTIAFIASFPIISRNFFQINLLTPFLNIIFVPIFTFIIYPMSILTFVIPSLDNIFSFIISITETISFFFSKFSVDIIIRKPNIVLFIVYYLLIFLSIKKRKYLIFLIILILINNNLHLIQKNSIITFLDVGQGDSILIEAPKREAVILIDTGGIYNRDGKTFIAKNTIIPYLKSRGIKKIDILALTHGHYDHIGETNDLINNFEIKKVLFNSGNTNLQEEIIIKNLKKNNIDYKKISKKDIHYQNFSFHFLNKKNINDENEDSLVLYTVLNEKKLLFMGDAGFETETYLIDNYNLKNLDILKIGHHGSRNSTSTRFLEQITPYYGIIQSGINNRFNHPHDEVIERLDNYNVNYLITSEVGSIRLTLKDNIFIETTIKKRK